MMITLTCFVNYLVQGDGLAGCSVRISDLAHTTAAKQ